MPVRAHARTYTPASGTHICVHTLGINVISKPLEHTHTHTQAVTKIPVSGEEDTARFVPCRHSLDATQVVDQTASQFSQR
jgi:hypothetical protein